MKIQADLDQAVNDYVRMTEREQGGKVQAVHIYPVQMKDGRIYTLHITMQPQPEGTDHD